MMLNESSILSFLYLPSIFFSSYYFFFHPFDVVMETRLYHFNKVIVKVSHLAFFTFARECFLWKFFWMWTVFLYSQLFTFWKLVVRKTFDFSKYIVYFPFDVNLCYVCVCVCVVLKFTIDAEHYKIRFCSHTTCTFFCILSLCSRSVCHLDRINDIFRKYLT